MLRRSICLLLSFISLLRHVALIWQYWGPKKNNSNGDVSYEILSNNSPSFLYYSTGHGVDENGYGMGSQLCCPISVSSNKDEDASKRT